MSTIKLDKNKFISIIRKINDKDIFFESLSNLEKKTISSVLVQMQKFIGKSEVDIIILKRSH